VEGTDLIYEGITTLPALAIFYSIVIPFAAEGTDLIYEGITTRFHHRSFHRPWKELT
jgi:hypothetical protein